MKATSCDGVRLGRLRRARGTSVVTVLLLGFLGAGHGWAQTAPIQPTQPVQPTSPRAPDPVRHFDAPGYVAATRVPDGAVPPLADGNFVIGPTHTPSTAAVVHEDLPHGQISTFTMRSEDSTLFPGIGRDQGTFGSPDPAHPERLVVTTSHPYTYVRTVTVYLPPGYVKGTEVALLIGADGPDRALFPVLDDLIAARAIPPMVAVSIGNGGEDAQGSERGLEYDTMSGRYAEFVEREVLPEVEQRYGVRLTHDPEGRATMGGSSGGSCALIMAWYHPEWYHRVLTYSGTFINQQWPFNPETPQGAWGFLTTLIPDSPAKPLRLWLEVGDHDLLNPNAMRDGMHDWVEANERMARVLADKGYHYQFVFAENAGHVDPAVRLQTLPEALRYLWLGYPGTVGP